LQLIIKDGKGGSTRIFPPFSVPYQEGIPCSAVLLDGDLTPIVRSHDLTALLAWACFGAIHPAILQAYPTLQASQLNNCLSQVPCK